MHDKKLSRRSFLKASMVMAAVPLVAACKADIATKTTVIDQVSLGQTGLKLSRLGFGAGSSSGNVQRALGTDGFNRLIRYAYDQGITYIDTADGYKTHTWIRDAIKGLPREKFFIQTKLGGQPENPLAELDRFRKELGMDYIDSVLIHCQIHPNWDESHKNIMDAFSEAKQRGIIRAHGVSCHSLPATTKAAQLDWVNVNLVRINPQGAKMDTAVETYFDDSTADHVTPVVEQIHIMRTKGHGIIGMKLIGDGDFTDPEDRRKSIHFAMQPGLLDAAVIGFKSTAEIDEAIKNINDALVQYGVKKA
jgi:predicted aldo/keto reductase-like oxidoreductase